MAALQRFRRDSKSVSGLRIGSVLRAAEGAPPLPLSAFGSSVLVIAPHPDDETLGCGGLLAQLFAAHAPCLVALLTDGAHSNPASLAWPPARIAAQRALELDAAMAELGGGPDAVMRLGFQDGNAPHPGEPAFEAGVAVLLELAETIAATSVVATWAEDPHGDHQAAAAMAARVADATGAAHWSYPIWSWMRPPDEPVEAADVTTGWLDISEVLDRKRRAIARHESQLGGLIEDDENCLPPEFLDHFSGARETYLRHAGRKVA